MDTEAIFRQVNDEFRCEHPRRRLTLLVASNGAQHYRVQCLRCGEVVRCPKKAELSPAELASVADFDGDLGRRWGERRSERYQALRSAAAVAEKEEFDAWYEDYLLTPAWRRKRALVMKRAGGMCEGCLERPAVQVHHLTYDHVGEELLFELVAICRECHRSIHQAKRPEFAPTASAPS